ncbi:hypothetical protein PSE_0641 [Pseudovibrio sp. FO-BEG1]|nr:hypothetical protein PSE_0641 [Pseudovibrio sp. FO-BEG1]
MHASLHCLDLRLTCAIPNPEMRQNPVIARYLENFLI